jgi:excisionase family DNA binding protein
VSTAPVTVDDYGWREHPDFSTFSDERLDLAQKLLDEESHGRKKTGNPILATYKEQEMRMLQAERGRRHANGNGNGTSLNSHNSLSSHSVQTFPKIHQAAFYGLAGDIVEAIEPYSEADPVAILVNVLAASGNCIGSGPHFLVEKSQHRLNVFVVQVGKSAKGRKGTAWSTPKFMFNAVGSGRPGCEGETVKMKTALSSTQPANPLLEGLKQLIQEAVREEIGKIQLPKPEKLLLNTKEAAELLDVKETWLAAAAREGRVEAVKLGHYIRFRRTDLEAFIAQMKTEGQRTAKPGGIGRFGPGARVRQ